MRSLFPLTVLMLALAVASSAYGSSEQSTNQKQIRLKALKQDNKQYCFYQAIGDEEPADFRAINENSVTKRDFYLALLKQSKDDLIHTVVDLLTPSQKVKRTRTYETLEAAGHLLSKEQEMLITVDGSETRCGNVCGKSFSTFEDIMVRRHNVRANDGSIGSIGSVGGCIKPIKFPDPKACPTKCVHEDISVVGRINTAASQASSEGSSACAPTI